MDKSGHKPAQPVNVDLGFRYTLLPAKLTIIFLSSLLNLAVWINSIRLLRWTRSFVTILFDLLQFFPNFFHPKITNLVQFFLMWYNYDFIQFLILKVINDNILSWLEAKGKKFPEMLIPFPVSLYFSFSFSFLKRTPMDRSSQWFCLTLKAQTLRRRVMDQTITVFLHW